MRKTKLRFPVKTASIILLCLSGVLFLLFFFVRYLTGSDYFKIEKSEFFTGSNIFKINLKKETLGLAKLYPDYKRVALQRSLPNRVVVDFIPRQAVAILRLSEDVFLDEEGVLFRSVNDEAKNLQLPLIIGLRSRIPQPQPGVKCNEYLFLAILEFINILNRDSELSEQLKIQQINLTNPNDVFMFTTAGCKINLGGIDSLNRDLTILRKLISEISSDLTEIEYIDIRFREPVIKYK